MVVGGRASHDGRSSLKEGQSRSIQPDDLCGLSVLVRTHSPGIRWHSREAARGAITEEADSGMIVAAKALAMNVIDLLMTPQLVEVARAKFTEAQDVGRQGQPRD